MINGPSEQGRRLLEASQRGEPSTVRALLRDGVSPDARWSEQGIAALMVAIDATTVEALVSAGADVNAQDDFGRTALMWQARRGDLTVLKSLLDAGADRGLRDAEGKLARDYASSVSHDRVLRWRGKLTQFVWFRRWRNDAILDLLDPEHGAASK